MVVYKKSRKTVKKVYKKKVYKKKPVVTKAVKVAIKKAISARAENKTMQNFIQDFTIYSSSNTSGFTASSAIPLTPYGSTFLPINQGVGQAGRIGNSITLKSLRFKGNIYPNPYNLATNATPQPSYIILWFYRYKLTPTTVQAPDATFLQLGNSSTGLTNSLCDRWAPVNTDAYTYLGRKVFKCGYSAFPSTTGGLPNYGNVYNNDFKMVCDFNIDVMKMCNKIIKWNDTSTIPSTNVVCCMPQAVASIGNYNNTSEPCKMDFIIDCSFEDM